MISKGTHLTFILEHQAEFHITGPRTLSPLNKADSDNRGFKQHVLAYAYLVGQGLHRGGTGATNG
jgi:hypothetical protein